MPEEKTTSIKTDAPAPEPKPPSPKVRDRRALPEGVVPKQAQAYVVAGLALLILLAVLFSKNHARTVPRKTIANPAAVSNDMNQRKIHELEEDLSADQRKSEQEAQDQKENDPSSTAGTSSTQSGTGVPSGQPPEPAQPAHDPIADAEKALAFKARFASNLILPVGAAKQPNADKNSIGGLSGQSDASSGNRSVASASRAATAAPGKHAPEVNIDAAHGRPYVVFEGTTIDTVLANRLDGEFAGPVKVMVTNPVYSRDGQHVLIPAGTFILGNVQKVSSFAQKRLAVTFHRMIMPDGSSVDLDQFHGLDQIGDTGLKDKVNHHYLQIFGASIALGVIAGAAESTTYGGYTENGSDMYRQGMASNLSQSSADVLNRFINIPPSITIREGQRIKIYLTQDLLLPAYDNHDMPKVM